MSAKCAKKVILTMNMHGIKQTTGALDFVKETPFGDPLAESPCSMFRQVTEDRPWRSAVPNIEHRETLWCTVAFSPSEGLGPEGPRAARNIPQPGKVSWVQQRSKTTSKRTNASMLMVYIIFNRFDLWVCCMNHMMPLYSELRHNCGKIPCRGCVCVCVSKL